jgi:hypothetical protein
LGRWGFSVLALVLATSDVAASCIEPATLAHSTVSVMRRFHDQETRPQPDVIAIRGTGWFLSPTSMVTIEHVAAAMNLSDQEWKPIEIGNGHNEQTIPVRIKRLVGSKAEMIAVLELQTAYLGTQGFQLRIEPLVPEEPVVSLAYPHSRMRVATGRFVQYGADRKLEGTALLEMYDGDDRLVLDHGASGAPVFDCAGRVGAVVSQLFTTTIRFPSGAARVSTAWGSPNVVSVPVPALQELSRHE